MTDNRFKPREIWNSLFLAGGDELEHELWCVVIRRVATNVLGKALGKSPWRVADEERESLITTWQDDSMPHSAGLAWAIGEYDYFRDLDLCWDEKLSLTYRPGTSPCRISTNSLQAEPHRSLTSLRSIPSSNAIWTNFKSPYQRYVNTFCSLSGKVPTFS